MSDASRVRINRPLEVLQEAGVVETISRIVRQSGLGAGQMIFELIQDALRHTSFQAPAGRGVAADHAARRQSPRLKPSRLPETGIKIDRELLCQARKRDTARSILTSIFDLGHRLGGMVAAEGVESRDHLALARRASVDYSRGYLVSRKRPLPELLAMQSMLGSTCESRGEPLQGVA